jgi:hypothetical protein
MRHLFIYALLLWVLASCSSGDNPNNLRKASGKPGDMLIVMDSTQWKGNLGKEVRKIFGASMPGLPQDEPHFSLVHLHPVSKTLLHEMRNVVYVFTLDKKSSGSLMLKKKFTEATLNKIKNDTAFHLSTRKDEFARNQEVMYLFANNEEELIGYLRKQKQNILDYFNKVERERLVKQYRVHGPSQFLAKEWNCDLIVPSTYKLADRTKDFVWFRQIGPNSDKDIFITYRPYVSEYQLLPDSLLELRDQTLKKYIFEDPEKPDTYLVTERKEAPIQARQLSFNKHFAIELRGLWRTNNQTMGGPFLGYGFVDEKRGLLYYIEGFAYNPGRDKREMMRELETILWTFKTSADLKKADDAKRKADSTRTASQ